MRLFNKAIEVNPNFAPAYLNRARLNLRNKRFLQAAGDAGKALGLAASDQEAAALLAQACREAAANNEQAPAMRKMSPERPPGLTWSRG